MTEVIKVRTGSPFEERESYSRVVVVGDWLFTSLTAGRNYATREMSDDVVEQTHQAFANAQGALESVGASLQDVVRSRIFIPNIDDVPVVMQVVGEYYRGIDPASTVTCTPLGGEFKVEIEITAYRGLSESPQRNITVDLSAE